MKKLIIILMILMASTVMAQQFDHNTRLAIGIGLQDVADIVKGNSNLGGVIRIAPIIPFVGQDTVSTANRVTNVLHKTYLVPYIAGGYYDDQYELNGGASVVYDFGEFYLRYNIQMAEFAQGEKPNSNIGHGMAFGLNFPSKWAEWIDSKTGVGFFVGTKVDFMWFNDRGEDDIEKKESMNITFVKIL